MKAYQQEVCMRSDPCAPPMNPAKTMIAQDWELQKKALAGDMETQFELDRRNEQELIDVELQRRKELARQNAADADRAYDEAPKSTTKQDASDGTQTTSSSVKLALCSNCGSIVDGFDCRNNDCPRITDYSPETITLKDILATADRTDNAVNDSQ